MIQIRFKLISETNPSGGDIGKALNEAIAAEFKKVITDKLKRVSGIQNEMVTITANLKTGKITGVEARSSEIEQKVIKALS